jgi:hypothetical protein
MMSGQDKLVAELMRGLRHERDELRLQMHLAKKELQDEWQVLDDRLDQLSQQYEPLRKAVVESTDDVWDSLKLVGSEIRDGFSKIRRSLSS